MNIVNFDRSHIKEAMKIVMINYEEERKQVPALPKLDTCPDLTHFADNHLGVAAFEGDRMTGFLCTYQPLENAFGIPNLRGTFSPIHAHGQIGENRDRVYSKLYQAAAEKWVKEGIVSHAIGLYTHDKEAVNSFFYNGFGLRCIDAIRPMENDIPLVDNRPDLVPPCEYLEVPKEEYIKLLELNNSLITHLGTSPIFMRLPYMKEKEFLKKTTEDIRYFAAKSDGRYIAYIKVGDKGENFITEDGSMQNICGAYCMQGYRGKGIYQKLLSYMAGVLKKEGYTRLGVDCESFNPNARGFWLKYFTEYTHSLVRRIDETAFANIVPAKSAG